MSANITGISLVLVCRGSAFGPRPLPHHETFFVCHDEQVRFSPRGRSIVGAAGRVDVIGERGEAMLIVQSDSKWGFVQTRQPALHVVPFDESTFAEVLQLVMRG